MERPRVPLCRHVDALPGVVAAFIERNSKGTGTVTIRRVHDIREVAREMESAEIELKGGVLWVTFTADTTGLTHEDLWWELAVFFDYVSLSDDVKVVVLRGPGSGAPFSATTRQTSTAHPDRHSVTLGTPALMLMRFYRNLLDCPQPIIASVNGDAIGAGISLTLHCDIVLAAEDVHFGDDHVSRGLITPVGGYMWPLHTNLHLAKEYLFTGAQITASEARELGLVNHVYSAGQLTTETDKLACRLAQMDGYAIRWTKKVMNRRVVRETLECQNEGVAWAVLAQMP